MRSEPEGEVSVVVLDFLVLLLTQKFLSSASEIWILEKYGRNFINGAPSYGNDYC